MSKHSKPAQVNALGIYSRIRSNTTHYSCPGNDFFRVSSCLYSSLFRNVRSAFLVENDFIASSHPPPVFPDERCQRYKHGETQNSADWGRYLCCSVAGRRHFGDCRTHPKEPSKPIVSKSRVRDLQSCITSAPGTTVNNRRGKIIWRRRLTSRQPRIPLRQEPRREVLQRRRHCPRKGLTCPRRQCF